jgi:hypothetical protein
VFCVMSPNKSIANARRAKRIIDSPSSDEMGGGDVSMNGGPSKGESHFRILATCYLCSLAVLLPRSSANLPLEYDVRNACAILM